MRINRNPGLGTPPSFTSIPATKARAFIARNYHEPSFCFELHYHPEWELTWTSSGHGHRYVGNSIGSFEAGELVLIAGNLPHTWFSDPSKPEEAKCSVIHFIPERFGDAFWQLPEIRSFHHLCESAWHGLRFTGENVEKIGALMSHLAEGNSANLHGFAELMEIFATLVETPHETLNAFQGESGGARPNPRLQELLDWIESKASEPITQKEAAERVRMSPASFSRWFKSQMGCVFQRYLTEQRVARACSLLVQENVLVTEVAFRAGFNNLSNFNRRFQEITGVTPKAFRKTYRGERED